MNIKVVTRAPVQDGVSWEVEASGHLVIGTQQQIGLTDTDVRSETISPTENGKYRKARVEVNVVAV